MMQPLFIFDDWGLLILRFVLGLVMVFHGWPKIKNLKATSENFGQLGFKPGIFWAVLVAIVEFGGGIFLMIGFLTQVVALLLAIQFIVILLKVKRGSKLIGGFELDLIILAMALALATLGSGKYSLEEYLGFWIY